MSQYGELSPEALEQFYNRAVSADVDAETLHRIRVLQSFVTQQESIAETCRRFGIARSTFHRWMDRFDLRDVFCLCDQPNPAAFRAEIDLSEGIIDLIRAYRTAQHYLSKDRISTLLMQEYQLSVSPSTIGRIIERECLYFGSTPFHQKKRIMAQGRTTFHEETHNNPSSVLLSENQEIKRESAQENEGTTELTLRLPLASWKRFALIASVMMNIVVLGSLLGMAFIESTDTKSDPTINSPLHASPSDSSYPW